MQKNRLVEDRIIRLEHQAAQAGNRAVSRASGAEELPSKTLPAPRRESAGERMARRIAAERKRRWDALIRRQNIQRETRRKLAAANSLSRPLTAAVFLSAGLLFGSCLFFLNQRAELSAAMTTVSALVQRRQDLSDRNSALAQEIEKQIDPETIFEYAVGRLGMSAPDSSRILRYRSTEAEQDTAVQGEQIP